LAGDIVDLVRKAGVVGAGGAGFPTHVKLDASVDTVIANGAECEPLLRVDRQLMDARAGEVVAGLRAVMKATGAKRGVLAVKKKYTKAISSLGKASKGVKGIDIHLLDNVYPAGDEYVLVYDVLQRLVPEGGIPLDVGVVVDNVGTLINIARAVDGRPVTGRYVTVTGAVRSPMTLEVPIGTPFIDLIETAGGATVDDYSIVVGGPMMGSVTIDTSQPVTKTTTGLIVLPREHHVIRTKTSDLSRQVVMTKSACIQCSLCTQICPRTMLGHDLDPHSIMRSIAWGVTEQPERFTGVFLCVECGLCTYFACPMGLDPCRMNREVKAKLIELGLKNRHNETDLEPDEFRSYRKVPVKRLVSRLDLARYDVDAPLQGERLVVGEVAIPLSQHIGAPAEPLVKAGAKVKEGQMIGGIPKGKLGAAVHASISGTVKEVSDVIRIKAE